MNRVKDQDTGVLTDSLLGPLASLATVCRIQVDFEKVVYRAHGPYRNQEPQVVVVGKACVALMIGHTGLATSAILRCIAQVAI